MAYYIWKSYKLKVDPRQIFAAFKEEKNSFFLDSSLNSSALGRYSFFGSDPFYVLRAKNRDAFAQLRGLLERYKIAPSKNSLPFCGGAVGYLAYDLGFSLEKKIKKKPKADLGIPDCLFGFYNTAVIIDHLKHRLYILATGFPEKRAHLAKLLSAANLKKTEKRLSFIGPPEKNNKKIKPEPCQKELKSNFSKEDYLSAVKKAKRYIKDGDIYQVNLSQRFEAKTRLCAFQIYQRLRQISPSYFGAYLDAGDFQVISSSPERFLTLTGDRVVTRPMKGTRPRGESKKEDISLRAELLKSAKDKAELTMIVDLERNDLGKVCAYDSVRVAALRDLEKYSTVYQTTATVEGRLYKGRDRVDLLRACFPGGSITGCPKIRAMEIIDELEPDQRSLYTGCLGYLSFSGSMDFNILIRTILKKKDRLYFGVGGGIVADSQPEEEYAETLVKARAMTEAIR
jgi:para-aminobenzoate synthetase component 1